jgi:hypothetical protein
MSLLMETRFVSPIFDLCARSKLPDAITITTAYIVGLIDPGHYLFTMSADLLPHCYAQSAPH